MSGGTSLYGLPAAPASTVFVSGGTSPFYGLGSNLRRFVLPPIEQKGGAIEIIDDPQYGTFFNIKEQGIYSITYGDQFTSSGTSMAIGRNVPFASYTTLGPGSFSGVPEVLVCSQSTAASTGNAICVTLPLVPGDVITAWTDGVSIGTSTSASLFRITKISPLGA